MTGLVLTVSMLLAAFGQPYGSDDLDVDESNQHVADEPEFEPSLRDEDAPAEVLSDNRPAISDAAAGFELTLPTGFAPLPEFNPSADVIHAFVDVDVLTGAKVLLFIERLPRPIPKGIPNSRDLPAGIDATISTRRWRGFDVPAIRIREQLDGVEAVTYNVQVPLQERAIQLKFLGALENEERLVTLLDETLDGLTGETNWIEPLRPSGYSAAQDRWVYPLAIGMIVVLCAILVGFIAIFRRAHRGTALGFAALLLVVSFLTAAIHDRWAFMLTGSVRVLGIGMLVYGIYDLFRRRLD